jgi:hypothetical protein
MTNGIKVAKEMVDTGMVDEIRRAIGLQSDTPAAT